MEALKWVGFAHQEVGGGWEGTFKVAEQWITAWGKCSLVAHTVKNLPAVWETRGVSALSSASCFTGLRHGPH